MNDSIYYNNVVAPAIKELEAKLEADTYNTITKMLTCQQYLKTRHLSYKKLNAIMLRALLRATIPYYKGNASRIAEATEIDRNHVRKFAERLGVEGLQTVTKKFSAND